MEKAVDDKRSKDSKIAFIIHWCYSNMGDINYIGPGMKNKIGKEGKSAWDTLFHWRV